MSRTYIVTGSASGIGQATVEILRSHGHRAIGADIRDAPIMADLSIATGRAEFARQAEELTGGRCDGFIAVAGVAVPNRLTVALNHFGTIASLNAVRPLLARAVAPRAVVIGSLGALAPIDDTLFDLLRAGDESAALAHADGLHVVSDGIGTSVLYTTSKRALSRWVREHASTPAWAGEGIALNVLAPGVTRTPITAPLLDTEAGRAAFSSAAPAPLNGPAAPAGVIGELAVWLAGEANSFVTGQIIYADGGSESMLRPELV